MDDTRSTVVISADHDTRYAPVCGADRSVVAVIAADCAVRFSLTVELGISAATRARNVGAAAAPVVGPAQTVFAVWVERAKVSAGVVVEVATEVVAILSILPALKLVTVPNPDNVTTP